jgi:subtilisin family serine protease
MNPVEMVQLSALMEKTEGHPDIVIGLIDGPVDFDHPEFHRVSLRALPGAGQAKRGNTHSAACLHGTLVAGILAARRTSEAPALCPQCTLLAHDLFAETSGAEEFPSAEPAALARAIYACIAGGARLLNLSIGLMRSLPKEDQFLTEALNYAAQQGALVVVASGNQSAVGGTALARHPWVIPVIAADTSGRPSDLSNVGKSIGRYGLAAPGLDILSLSPGGATRQFSGTSAATPFVTGALALLWSLFPAASPVELKQALLHQRERSSIVPPLLDAHAAWRKLAARYG